MQFKIPADDAAVFKAASSLATGGMRAFTSYMFADLTKKPRWDLVHVSPDEYKARKFNRVKEFVPWVPLTWQYAMAHCHQKDLTIIGAMGCSKTCGAAGAGVYWCMMSPDFQFLGAAPTAYQASQMKKATLNELIGWKRRDTNPRPIHKYITKVVDRPYPRIEFWNNSTMEFMSADKQGQKILTWSGDAIIVDQAESFPELEKLMENLGTRVRGIVQDRKRMGKFVLMANAEYHPTLWERFDMGIKGTEGALPEEFLSVLLTIDDNPYLTEADKAGFVRRITDPVRRRQLLYSERPMPRGKEFTPELLEPAQDKSLDENMAHQIQQGTPGFKREVMQKAGVWLWETPASEFDEYVEIGDPGQGRPPYRNSPCIMVFKVTGFPELPAELAAFWWGSGNGSYWPFIYKFEEYLKIYRPRAKAFDATGSQKGMDELCFQQRGVIIEGLNMAKWKQQMVVTLKLLLGKKLIRMPKSIGGIWMQLAGWHMPDTKLRQDVASTLFMAAFIIQRLYSLSDIPSEAQDAVDVDPTPEDRFHGNRRLREERHGRIKR